MPSEPQSSRMSVVFTDYDTNRAPYEGRALKLSLSSDVLFVSVGTLTETRDSDTFTAPDDMTIGVDAEALYEALGVMLRRDDRYSRERLSAGTLPHDHPAAVMVNVAAPIVATRRRA